MRRLLLVAGVLAAALVVTVVLALANLDRVIDANRDRIVAEIAKGFGRPVEVGRIAVGFHGGIAVELDDLRVADDPAFSTDPFLSAASTHAVVRLWPLLRGRIAVRRIVATAPQVAIVRTAAGMNVDSLGRTPRGAGGPPSTPGGGAPSSAGASGGVAALAIALVSLEGGTVRWVDRTASPAVETTIAPLDLRLSDLTLTAPLRIDLRATVAGTPPTVVHARGTLGPIGDPPFAADVAIDQLVSVHGGTLDVVDLAVGGTVRRDAAGRPIATLRVGAPALRAGDVDVTALAIAVAEANQATVLEKMGFGLLGGTITGTGRIERVRSPAVFGLQTTVRGVDMTQLLALREPDVASRLAGRLDADWTLTGSAGDEAAVRRSLAGNGRVVIRDGVLEGVNVADAVLSGATGIGGLVSLVPPRVRDHHPDLFASDDTRFDELATDVRVANERIVVDSLVVSAKHFTIHGQGTVGFDRRTDLDATLFVSAPLTAELVGVVRQAKVLAGADGRIAVPFRLTGTLPDVKARPDREFLLRALRKALAEEGLDGLLGGGGDGKAGGNGKGGGKRYDDPAARLRRKLDRLFR